MGCDNNCQELDSLHESAANLIKYSELINQWLNGTEDETVNIGGKDTQTVLGLYVTLKKMVERFGEMHALAENLTAREATMTVAENTAAGTIFDLPDGMKYAVGRYHLRISYDGVILSSTFFEEIGEEAAWSTQVKLLIPLKKGQELCFWVIPLGTQGLLDAVNAALGHADNAATSASQAATSATNAANSATAAAGSANSASASAQEAAEQAELAARRLIVDDNVSTGTTYSSSKITNEILSASNALKDDLLGGAGEAYDTLKELADLIQTNQGSIDALEALAAGHVKYNGEQTLTDEQKGQARGNIGAAAASDVTSVTNRVTAVEGVAAGNTAAINALKNDMDNFDETIADALETLLQSGIEAQEATLTLTSDVAANSVITLPSDLQYFVGKHQLRISYDGVALSPSFYQEVGAEGEPSRQIKTLIPLKSGQELDFWISPVGIKDEVSAYSLDEKVVGTWVDGKPLYRKVWQNKAYNASGVLTPGLSVADLHVETVVRLEGMRDAGTGIFPIGGNAYLYYNANVILGGTIRGAGSINAGTYKHIIFEYTKTTDTTKS